MKLIPLFLLFTVVGFGQSFETATMWRTKGVYDTLGNFLDRAKIQSFLYITQPNEIQRLTTQDKINRTTGETKVFTYRDTLTLLPLHGATFQITPKETLTLHRPDSLPIQYKHFHIAYVRLKLPPNPPSPQTIKKALMDQPVRATIAGKTKYQFTYQKNGLVKIQPIGGGASWESNYLLIHFNGYAILQGIVSAPKLLLGFDKTTFQLLEIDYRFDSKKGQLELVDP